MEKSKRVIIGPNWLFDAGFQLHHLPSSISGESIQVALPLSSKKSEDDDVQSSFLKGDFPLFEFSQIHLKYGCLLTSSEIAIDGRPVLCVRSSIFPYLVSWFEELFSSQSKEAQAILATCAKKEKVFHKATASTIGKLGFDEHLPETKFLPLTSIISDICELPKFSDCKDGIKQSFELLDPTIFNFKEAQAILATCAKKEKVFHIATASTIGKLGFDEHLPETKFLPLTSIISDICELPKFSDCKDGIKQSFELLDPTIFNLFCEIREVEELKFYRFSPSKAYETVKLIYSKAISVHESQPESKDLQKEAIQITSVRFIAHHFPRKYVLKLCIDNHIRYEYIFPPKEKITLSSSAVTSSASSAKGMKRRTLKKSKEEKDNLSLLSLGFALKK
ncbi:hypothetical protein ADUPG1_007186 [Aduncisulcus paluster]|uniref:Uncharacterized protein n=1 Tax=Aduncisulcus paluster TaxID=2918883 RepID=A0ABQ5KL23_9EUKA|nr:hypothetical protein ADUPG1_007186 [Aduncisulcus paluster]